MLVLMAGVHAGGQSQPAKAPAPVQTADGQPDIQGFWAGRAPGAFYHLEEGLNDPTEIELIPRLGSARPAASQKPASPPPAYKGIIVDPPTGKVPYQPWAAAKRKDVLDHYKESNGNLQYIDTNARCFALGVPRTNYMGSSQILQRPGSVVILNEYDNHYRIIPIDGRPHVSPRIRQWIGDSVGRWEGNTLVVDVTNFNGKAWMDMTGDFNSEDLHVVERFTVVDADSIAYEATIEDPKVYTRPWKIAFPIARLKAEGYESLEYACHEGNLWLKDLKDR